MKTKALITGALPPCVGPWVRIDDGRIWRVIHPAAVSGVLEIDVEMGWESHTISPNGQVTEISGKRARAVVKRKVEGLRELSVTLEEVRS